MKTPMDLTGLVFGRLTVLQRCKDKTRAIKWECLCSCGKHKIVVGSNLRSGTTKSCGCLSKEVSSQLGKELAANCVTHGLRQHPVYKLWNNMMTRCHNPKYHRYEDYGGRGIQVCEKWHDTATFITWAVLNGWEKGLQIDRKDNNGPYSPDNCRFVGNSRNMANQRPIRSNNTSGYRGVQVSSSAWNWRVTYKGQTHRGFGFPTPYDAAFARNWYIHKNRIPATLNIL